MKREVQFAKSLEVRQQPGRPSMIRGYAATFNTLSRPLASGIGGSFVELIAPGAFAKAIAQDDVRALVDHDPSKILVRTKSGTLMLREDSQGLYCEIEPPDTTAGRDVVASIERGDLDAMSFGFETVDESWGKTEDGQQLRELREVKLYDVSVVTYPAYPSTSVAMRSLFPDGVPTHIQKRMTQMPDHAAALKSIKAAMKVHSIMVPDGINSMIGFHLKAAYKALGGALDESGNIAEGGDNTTQQPSRSIPYAWMSPRLQEIYRNIERRRKLDKDLASVDPRSTFGRKLKVERELAEIEQDLAQAENLRMKSELHERWRLKDECSVFPLYRDLALYAKKPADERREKDPWAAYRLF